MRFTIAFIFMFFLIGSLPAQFSDAFRMKPQFISFQKTRLSLGIDGAIGFARLTPKPENLAGGRRMQVGLLADLYSPLSVVGFVVGGELGFTGHKFGEKDKGALTGDSTDFVSLEVPLFVKLRIGPVSSDRKLIIMAGLSYNYVRLPVLFSDFYSRQSDKSMSLDYLDYRVRLGFEFASGRQKRDKYTGGGYVSDARGRVLFYIGASYSKSPMYNGAFENAPANAIIDFNEIGKSRNINFFGGLSVFFTLKKWGEVITKKN